ncbi:MAG TPA: acyl-CoA dehydrogenase family protein [Mycobacteriales bacterium]|nr:acyl-CoA dehydrogenase family protein [Mycobacteriales bacterium]
MNLDLSAEQMAVRELYADLFANESTPERIRAAEPLGYDPALWAQLIGTGALGIAVPEGLGGAGAGLLELVLLAEEAGRRLASIPIAEVLASVRLLAEFEARDLLEESMSGAKLVSLATGTASLADQTLADGAVADYVIALDGERLVVLARPAVVRHLPNAGSLPMARWHDATEVTELAVGSRARQSFDVACDEVRILRSALLVGLSFEAIEIGAAYARERRAFGLPIGGYQAVAHPLADAIVATDGAQLLTWKACWAAASRHATAPSLASMAFIFAGQTAFFAAQHSLHIHGGYGFMAEYDIQLYFRRSKAWQTIFADPQLELHGLADRRFGPVLADTAGDVS